MKRDARSKIDSMDGFLLLLNTKGTYRKRKREEKIPNIKRARNPRCLRKRQVTIC